MVGGGLQHFSVSPRPLGFGFGTKGFGAKVLGPGLDNYCTRNKGNLDNLLLSFIMCIIPFIRSESCVIRLTMTIVAD